MNQNNQIVGTIQCELFEFAKQLALQDIYVPRYPKYLWTPCLTPTSEKNFIPLRITLLHDQNFSCDECFSGIIQYWYNGILDKSKKSLTWIEDCTDPNSEKPFLLEPLQCGQCGNDTFYIGSVVIVEDMSVPGNTTFVWCQIGVGQCARNTCRHMQILYTIDLR